MTNIKKYIIKIDDDYLVSFEGNQSIGRTSHIGWDQRYTELKQVELSMVKTEAKIFEGNINLKSALDKLYDRMRYDDLYFDHLEIFCCE